MRCATSALAVMFLTVLVGCQQVDQVFNPRPTSGGGRGAAKLMSLPAPDPSKIKTATVYRLENKTSFIHGLEITNGMTDMLITALVQSGHFRVVERATLGDLMTERGLSKSGEATGEAAATPLASAQLIFTGAVTELGETTSGGVGLDRGSGSIGVQVNRASVALDLRVVDAATGQIIDSIPIRKTHQRTGIAAARRKWGVGGNITITDTLDTAIRETIEEAVYQLVSKHGAM